MDGGGDGFPILTQEGCKLKGLFRWFPTSTIVKIGAWEKFCFGRF